MIDLWHIAIFVGLCSLISLESFLFNVWMGGSSRFAMVSNIKFYI